MDDIYKDALLLRYAPKGKTPREPPPRSEPTQGVLDERRRVREAMQSHNLLWVKDNRLIYSRIYHGNSRVF
jgi:hypothetical protein